MSMDLNIIRSEITKKFPTSQVSLLQFSNAQKLNIQLDNHYFVLETDPDEEGFGFAQVQAGALDFGGYDTIIALGDRPDIAAQKVAALITKAIKVPYHTGRTHGLDKIGK